MPYHAEIYRYCYAQLRNAQDAEDAAMEAMLALLRLPGWLCSRRDPKLYALGVARRKVADILRKRRTTASQVDSGTPLPAWDIGGTLWQLDPDHREVLVYRFMLGLTAEETGALMARSAPAIDSLVQRAKTAFRAIHCEASEVNL